MVKTCGIELTAIYKVIVFAIANVYIANYLNELAIMSPMFDKHSNINGMPTIA